MTLLLVALGLFLPLDMALFLLLGDERSLLMAAVTGLIGVAWYLSRRAIDRGQLNRAVVLTSFSFLVPTLLLVLVRPYLFPVLAVGPVLAIAVTVPLARGRVLGVLTATAATFMAAIVVLGSFLAPRTPNELPAEIATPIFSGALMIVLGLVLLAVWQFGSRLAKSIVESAGALAALRDSNAQLKRGDEFKTQFMNTAAHEINTPLTPIRLQLHMLRSGGVGTVDDAAHRALDIVDRNVERVADLVRDVLDASRIQGGRLALAPSLIDVRELVREVFESFRDPARVTGVELELESSQPLPTFADARRVNQVLFNLVGNALKFTPHGGRIKVHADLADTEIQVRVADTGAGFKPQEATRLFRPFSQLDNRPRAAPGGTGLGLFISRGIIAEHGGRVGASSPGPGLGSTFWFALPVKSATIVTAPETVALASAELRVRQLI